MRIYKILIIDDDIISLKILDKKFKSFNFQVTVFDNCYEGLNYLNLGNTVDIILCDVNLPSFSGLEFINKIKSIQYMQNIPIIMLSGSGTHDQVIEFITKGAKDYIIKPITNEKIEKILKNLKLNNYEQPIEIRTDVSVTKTQEVEKIETKEQAVNLIDKWKVESQELSIKHNNTANYYKTKYNIFGLLQLLIPIGFTLANQLIEDPDSSKAVSSVGFALSGITTVLLNFLNFKVASTKHGLASNSYRTMVNDIESTMSNPDNINIQVTIEKIKNEMKNLQNYSPGLDDSCVSDYCFKR